MEIQPGLEALIGSIVNIPPQQLLNRGLLYTTQTFIDIQKVALATQGRPLFEDESPRGWIGQNKRGKTFYVLGDGNHRTSLACLEGRTIPFHIEGIWDGLRPMYGFNMVLSKFRSEYSASFH